MATIHKISEGLFVDSFELIAVHSNLESYAVAYHINKAMGLRLCRVEKDLEIGKSSFPMYEWKDTYKDQEWFLMSNKVTEETVDHTSGLFQNGPTLKSHYLISEKKEINYIIKLTSENSNGVDRAVGSIREIPKISMAYQLDVEALKSKRNLIF